MQDLALGEAELLDVVADMARQAAAMGEQVADRDLGRASSSWRAKPGSMSRMRLSHATLPSLDQRRTMVADSGLEIEASWNTVSRSTGSGFDLPHAEGLEEDDFVPMNDGDREAGHHLPVDDLPREASSLGSAAATFCLVAVCARTGGETSTAATPASRVRLEGLRICRPSFCSGIA